MADPTPASAHIPPPQVGTGTVVLPSSPAVDAALDQYQAALNAYRTDPNPDTKAAKAQAAHELRRQRSLLRGGTDTTTQEG